MRKATKQCVLSWANKLGYTVEVIGTQIYLTKGEELVRKKSFFKAYHFLYAKNKKQLKLNNAIVPLAI